MDNKEYISSGILELYAAGLLSESESDKVEDAIRNNPEIRKEYEDIQKAVYISSLQNFKAPNAKVKSAILERINSAHKPVTRESEHIGITHSNRSGTYRYLMAASIAFLALSLIVNYFLWTKLKDAENKILVLNDQKKIMVQDLEKVNSKLAASSKDMEIMRDRNYKIIDMKGLEKSPSSNVIAFWNPDNKKVYIEVLSLPVQPHDKQYQLWAIANGKPVDAGVMDVDPSDKSLHEMKSMDDAQAFAITLEPKGGSVSPTMDQMYVMGSL